MPDPKKLPENIPGEQWKLAIDIVDDERILSTVNVYLNIIRNWPGYWLFQRIK